ncbi:MAG: hypothetical protein ACJ796_03685 [Gemmatimonadaceae bacterium]
MWSIPCCSRELSWEGAIIRIHSITACLALVLLGSLPLRGAAGQNEATAPGYAEYLALLGTPTASLSPLGTYTILGVAQRTPQLVARYGYNPDITRPLAPNTGGHLARPLDSFGLTGILPVGLGATVSLTTGFSNERCDGCYGSAFMASLAGDYRITTVSLAASNAFRLIVGANAELGVGHPEIGTTWTANVGVPLAFAIGDQSGTSVTPFITPSAAFVTTSGSSAISVDGAVRGLLAAGASLYNAKSMFSATVGLQTVFVSHTELVLGFSLSFGGR